MTEFPDLGKHCEVSSCKQLDFLPFTCKACNKTCCLDHRSYDAHSCPKAHLTDNVVVVCGECGKGVDSRGDADGALANHLANQCRGAQKQIKCIVRGCKAKMGVSGTTCKICQQPVCLSHRFETDHGCPGPMNTKRKQGGGGGGSRGGYGSAGHPSSSSRSKERSSGALCADCVIC